MNDLERHKQRLAQIHSDSKKIREDVENTLNIFKILWCLFKAWRLKSEVIYIIKELEKSS